MNLSKIVIIHINKYAIKEQGNYEIKKKKHLYLNGKLWGLLSLILFIYLKTKFRGVVARTPNVRGSRGSVRGTKQKSVASSMRSGGEVENERSKIREIKGFYYFVLLVYI